jgi:hypothetical protein
VSIKDKDNRALSIVNKNLQRNEDHSGTFNGHVSDGIMNAQNGMSLLPKNNLA